MTQPLESNLHARAAALIRELGLAPHPEGGFYLETYRSTAHVAVEGRPSRSALTTIYFLLAAGSFSAWHRVRSDEVWHWYEGEPLELLLVSPDFSTTRRHILGPVGPGIAPVATAPADWWQAARPLGRYALCGCTVAPGFEFADFAFLRNHMAECAALQSAAPDLVSLL
jgi:predicted cupin superfamily sugar epimerase